MQGGRWLLRTSSPIVLAVSTIAAAGSAWAAELDWQAPPGCPEREIVQHRVRLAIGMPLEQAGTHRFKCVVTRAPKGLYRLELRVEVPSVQNGEPPRIIDAATCAQVAHTAVGAIALALGANSAAEAPGATDAVASEPESPRDTPKLSAADKTKETAGSAVPGSAAAPIAAPASRSHLWLAARFGPVVDAGSLPGLAFGLEPTVHLGYRAVSARLSGSVFADRRKTLADGSGGEFSLWGVALSLCGSTPREHSHARLCAGLEVGKMTGSGFGAIADSRQASATWVLPRLEVELLTEPWFFGVRGAFGAMAGVTLTRRPFTFGTVEQVHRPERLAARLSGGLEIDW